MLGGVNGTHGKVGCLLLGVATSVILLSGIVCAILVLVVTLVELSPTDSSFTLAFRARVSLSLFLRDAKLG